MNTTERLVPTPVIRQSKKPGRADAQPPKPATMCSPFSPDINGYRPPPNVRSLKFHDLLSNALQQFMTRSQQVYILAKVPRGMMVATTAMTSRFTDSASPWIPEEPANISEAFDTFSGDNSLGQGDTKFYLVSHPIGFEPVDFSREALPDLINLWESTADTVRHAVLLAPSGPCAGGSRGCQNGRRVASPLFRSPVYATPGCKILSEGRIRSGDTHRHR